MQRGLPRRCLYTSLAICINAAASAATIVTTNAPCCDTPHERWWRTRRPHCLWCCKSSRQISHLATKVPATMVLKQEFYTQKTTRKHTGYQTLYQE